MLILGVESPEGQIDLRRGGVPERVRQDQLRDDDPAQALRGLEVWTVGDDIAWMRVGADGRLWAVNPEAGYFGVAPGHELRKSNPNAMKTHRARTPSSPTSR